MLWERRPQLILVCVPVDGFYGGPRARSSSSEAAEQWSPVWRMKSAITTTLSPAPAPDPTPLATATSHLPQAAKHSVPFRHFEREAS